MFVTDRLPEVPFDQPQHRRLPGLAPLPPGAWIVDYPDTAAQLAERARLIATRRAEVLDCLPEAREAASELLEALLAHLATRPGWEVGAAEAVVPGGVRVAVDREDPLGTAGRIVSEDFCLMGGPGSDGGYRLIGAVLCFPAHWRLAEKIGRPMAGIHEPVPQYDADVGQRVDRVFGVLRAGAPLMRLNWTVTASAELFTPVRSHDRARVAAEGGALYLRVERQTFVRLPRTGVIVFGIRTSLAPLESLGQAQREGFFEAVGGLSEGALAYKGGAELFRLIRGRLRG